VILKLFAAVLLVFTLSSAAHAQQNDRPLINIGAPIHYVAPVFPAGVMPSNEKVRLSFTVLEDGTVDATSIEVIETSNVLYNLSATDALAQFRYRPRLEGGKPVKTPRSRTTIEYRIEVR
jgi:TonB-like protein|tara:strand:- start:74530 stop:74889 length:360 start_codon:yes stop_codon:yes gene_type:complete